MMNFFRRRKIFELNPDNPTYKVSYLGNVATIAARPSKQPFCRIDEILRPLNRLWAAHLVRPNKIGMQLTVCNDGLKVVTEQYGLVEYWAHRITFCGVHPDFPNVFVWIYRHDGKNMKPDLRFHGALFSKSEKAERVTQQLQQKLRQALLEFKREKLSKQRSRLRHENLMLKCAELADLFVCENSDAQSLVNARTCHNHSEFEQCSLDSACDCATQPAPTDSNCSSTTTIHVNDADFNCTERISTCPIDGATGSGFHTAHHQSSPKQLVNDHSAYSRNIQPKRKDLKSCSKNYRPNVPQVGAPKLHSIDEETEEQYCVPLHTAAASLPVGRHSFTKFHCAQNPRQLLPHDLNFDNDRHCHAKPIANGVSNSNDLINTAGNSVLPKNAVLLEVDSSNETCCRFKQLATIYADVVAEDADLSDDGVFCKASNSSNSSRESECMQFTGSSASSSTSRTSHSITDEDDDDEGDAPSVFPSVTCDKVVEFDGTSAACVQLKRQCSPALLSSFVVESIGDSHIQMPVLSSSTVTSSPEAATMRHTPVLSGKRCFGAESVEDYDETCENHSDEDGVVLMDMKHFDALLLEKRLGRLAMADLKNA